MTRNFVKLPDTLRVIKECESMKTDIEAGKYTLETLAGFLSQKLTVKLSPGNIRSILEAANIKRPALKSHDGRISSIYHKLETRVEQLEARLTAMEEEVKTAPLDSDAIRRIERLETLANKALERR